MQLEDGGGLRALFSVMLEWTSVGRDTQDLSSSMQTKASLFVFVNPHQGVAVLAFTNDVILMTKQRLEE